MALDARELNRAIVKDKYQMPNMESLIHLVAELLDKPKEETCFTSLDMQYAQGHLLLHRKAAELCSFQIIGVEAIGKSHFITGFSWLTTKPIDFQKVKDQTLDGLSNSYPFIDDILVATKNMKTEHWVKIKKVWEKMGNSKMCLKLDKCTFAKTDAKWLGFHFSQIGVKPFQSRVHGFTDRWKPRNLMELRSILGAVNQVNCSQNSLFEFPTWRNSVFR